MHGDQALATDYDDPMRARLIGTAADVLRSFVRCCELRT